jgi:hypothetical protein
MPEWEKRALLSKMGERGLSCSQGLEWVVDDKEICSIGYYM